MKFDYVVSPLLVINFTTRGGDDVIAHPEYRIWNKIFRILGQRETADRPLGNDSRLRDDLLWKVKIHVSWPSHILRIAQIRSVLAGFGGRSKGSV